MKKQMVKFKVVKPKVTVTGGQSRIAYVVQSSGTAVVSVSPDVRIPRKLAAGRTVEVRQAASNSTS